MADIYCKNRKTQEEKVLPETVFDAVNDVLDPEWDFMYYVDEKGARLGAANESDLIGQFSNTEVKAELVEAINKLSTEPNLDDLTVAELKELAKERGVDLGVATKKADILALLKS